MMRNKTKTLFDPEAPLVPEGWWLLPFKETAKIVSDKGKRIKQGNYLKSGKISIIDQGQEFIGGYTNDENMIFDGDLPVILFGDHTRSIKYVDKQFAVGAEGIKILAPADSYLPKFYFYLLHSLQIPSRGYSRHFQFLKNFHLPATSIDKQKRIVAEIEKQFSRLDEAVAGLKRAKANLERYKAAILKAAVEGRLTEQWRKEHPDVEPAEELLQRILSERRAKWEQAELAKMKAKGQEPKDNKWKHKYKEPLGPDQNNLTSPPHKWIWCSSDQIFWFVTSGSRGWAKYYSNEGPIFLRIGNLDHNSIELDLKNIQRVLPSKGAEGIRTHTEANDILISITADVGMVAVIPQKFEDAYINQHIALSRPIALVDPLYIGWYLNSRPGQRQFQKLQRGATKVGLGLDDIRTINIPMPPIDEQKEIVEQISRRLTIFSEIGKSIDINLRRSERLRQSILKKAFSGQLLRNGVRSTI
jgi:type I restriction enzyme, S subunit